jgi:hypothetical protein
MQTASYVLLISLMWVAPSSPGQTFPIAAPSGDTFTNPLLPVGPDPWVTFKDGMSAGTASSHAVRSAGKGSGRPSLEGEQM